MLHTAAEGETTTKGAAACTVHRQYLAARENLQPRVLSAPHASSTRGRAYLMFSNQLSNRPRAAALGSVATAAAAAAAAELPERHHHADQRVNNGYRSGGDGCACCPHPGRERGARRTERVRARGERGADGLAHRSDGVDDRRGARAQRGARGAECASRGGGGGREGCAQRGQHARAGPRERGAERGVERAGRRAEGVAERPQHVLRQPVAGAAEGLAGRAHLVKGGAQ